MLLSYLWTAVCVAGLAAGQAHFPVKKPFPPPPYMVDNQMNTHGQAPDKGTLDQAITSLKQLDAYHEGIGMFSAGGGNGTEELVVRQSSYWYPGIAHGQSPLAPSGYTVYRNVQDPAYGAKGDGKTDDTAAINKAITAGNRCGQSCGSSSVLYAVIYFPPGIYMVSAPIIQYYYTLFIGDPTNRPTIKGTASFQGIALIDNDVYIPGGNGNEWYINQNQFYRTIRNFVIDLTLMPNNNTQGDQTYVPTGIHWQVAQATSLQNIQFNMREAGADPATKAVGIFMENGSGGFVSDLSFQGGNIGFRAGSQQFTARGLTFVNCLTAVSMVWDWGFTWQQMSVTNSYVAIDCTSFGGVDGQGTGSISVVDSYYNHVSYAIPYSSSGPVPNVVLDNLVLNNVPQVVLVSGGSTILAGPTSGNNQTVVSWGQGRRYQNSQGTAVQSAGNFSPQPTKPAALLDSSGRYFTQSKPTYQNNAPSVVATSSVKNDGTGDQSSAINTLLKNNVGKVIFFPAGIYNVQGTVIVPVGSIIVGEAWSQIRGSGTYFQDATNPQPVVRVGNAGDVGTIQLSDLLFTVSGPTAGAVLLEWNVKQKTQGSAAMWDCHFRVGGASGSSLGLSQCPKGSNKAACKAASMLFHLTASGSGYFENIWAWVADHDLDASSGSANTTSSTQISVFSARGVLIESQGPSWFYGTASEHSILYQYELYKAKNIYFGHMQTETPYYQPTPQAPAPFTIGKFNGDPDFSTYGSCTAATCKDSWALRILNSTNIFIYSAGFYSFFNNYAQACVPTENCQARLIDTAFTQGLWLYNLFTKGTVQAISPEGLPIVLQGPNQLGYTTEISAYLALATSGGNLGNATTTPPPYMTCRPREL